MSAPNETMAKVEVAASAAVTTAGAIGISFADVMELWLLCASAVAMTAGAAYTIWKLWRDIRGAQRKNRRQSDKPRGAISDRRF